MSIMTRLFADEGIGWQLKGNRVINRLIHFRIFATNSRQDNIEEKNEQLFTRSKLCRS